MSNYIQTNYELLIDILKSSTGDENIVIDNQGFIPADVLVQAITTSVNKNEGTLKPKPSTPTPPEGGDGEWQPPTEDNYTPIAGEYFYIRSVDNDNTIYLSDKEYRFGQWLGYLDYSYDQENWQPASGLTDVTLNKNQKIYFKNNGRGVIPKATGIKGTLPSTKGVAIGGNAITFYSANNQQIDLDILKFQNISVNDEIQEESDWFTKSKQKLINIDNYTDFTDNSKGGNGMFRRNPWLLQCNTENMKFTTANQAFRQCKKLQIIKNLDISSVRLLTYTFDECENLKGFVGGNFNTSNVTNFTQAFNHCYSLESLPEGFTTVKATTLRNMFSDCNSLTTVPTIDCTNAIDIAWAFGNCGSLKRITIRNTSNVQDMGVLFHECYSLEEIDGTIDCSSVKSGCFSHFVKGCGSLKRITGGIVNLINDVGFYATFQQCGVENLADYIPDFESGHIGQWEWVFWGCSNLHTIPKINMSSASNTDECFGGCPNLQNINMEGSINVDLSFSSSPLLTYDSVKSILTAANNTTNTNAKTLTFAGITMTDINGELQALVDSCISKGWTINNLIIN